MNLKNLNHAKITERRFLRCASEKKVLGLSYSFHGDGRCLLFHFRNVSVSKDLIRLEKDYVQKDKCF